MPESWQNMNSAMMFFDTSLNNLTQSINAYNKMNWDSENANKMRDYYEKMAEKQNDWNLNMWNRVNEYNSPDAQVQRLRDAGLNPLYYGLDGSSANALESAQPLGYERASASVFGNPQYQSGIEAMLRGKQIDAQTRLTEAQINKIKEDTESVGLDNEWKEKTMEARAESEQLKNEVLRSDIRIKEQDFKNKVQELSKLVAETDNEITKHGYILAQTALEEAMKKKTDEETATIVALRPYEIQLKQAQTDAQKAAAAAQYANALLTNGLIDAGYIDKQIDLIAAQCENYEELAKTQEAQRFMAEFKNAVKSGNVFDFLNGGKPRGKFGQFVADFGSFFFQFMSIAGDAIGTIPGAGSAIGGAVGAAAGVKAQSVPAVKQSNVSVAK